MFKVLSAVQDREEWDRCISYLTHDLRDVYLMSGWGRLYETGLATAKLAVLVDEKLGYIVCQPFLHRKIEGTGYTDMAAAGFGGPFTSHAIPAREDGLLFEAEFARWRTAHAVVSEFYLLNPIYAGHQFTLLPSLEWIREERTVYMVHLGSDEEILMRMRDTRVQSIGKAHTAVMAVASPSGMEHAYQLAMREKGAADRWRMPVGYFERMGQELEQHSVIFSAVHPVEGPKAIATFIRGTACAYYSLAATMGRPMTGYADRCVTEAMMWARAAGCEWLNMGGGMEDGDTLASYKKSFGGFARKVYSVCRVHDERAYRLLSGDLSLEPRFFPAYRAKEAE